MAEVIQTEVMHLVRVWCPNTLTCEEEDEVMDATKADNCWDSPDGMYMEFRGRSRKSVLKEVEAAIAEARQRTEEKRVCKTCGRKEDERIPDNMECGVCEQAEIDLENIVEPGITV